MRQGLLSWPSSWRVAVLTHNTCPRIQLHLESSRNRANFWLASWKYYIYLAFRPHLWHLFFRDRELSNLALQCASRNLHQRHLAYTLKKLSRAQPFVEGRRRPSRQVVSCGMYWHRTGWWVQIWKPTRRRTSSGLVARHAGTPTTCFLEEVGQEKVSRWLFVLLLLQVQSVRSNSGNSINVRMSYLFAQVATAMKILASSMCTTSGLFPRQILALSRGSMTSGSSLWSLSAKPSCWSRRLRQDTRAVFPVSSDTSHSQCLVGARCLQLLPKNCNKLSMPDVLSPLANGQPGWFWSIVVCYLFEPSR